MLYLVFTLLFDAKPQEIGRDSCFFISISCFSCHFFSMHHILQETTFHVSWWGHLGDLAASTKNTAVHFPHLGRSHRCRPLTKPRSCEFEWGKIVTYCYILKNPYTEETLKNFHQGHISCWSEKFVCLRIFLVGICGPAAYETVAWRWLKPFRLGHSQLDKVDCISIMAICQRPALSSEFSWGKAMDPKLWLKNFGKRWSMSCQHLVWTNLHLKNSRPKLDKAQLVGGVFPTVSAQLLADSSWRSIFLHARTISVNESLFSGTQVSCKMIFAYICNAYKHTHTKKICMIIWHIWYLDTLTVPFFSQYTLCSYVSKLHYMYFLKLYPTHMWYKNLASILGLPSRCSPNQNGLEKSMEQTAQGRPAIR